MFRLAVKRLFKKGLTYSPPNCGGYKHRFFDHLFKEQKHFYYVVTACFRLFYVLPFIDPLNMYMSVVEYLITTSH